MAESIQCPRCGLTMPLIHEYAGQRMACPECGEAFVIESTLERIEITPRVLLPFIADLPDRMVVRKFPNAAMDQVPLNEIREYLRQQVQDAPLVTAQFDGVLQVASKKDGWLCLEYRCSLARIPVWVQRLEPQVATDAVALQIVRSFRAIEGRTQIGIGREEYAESITSLWLLIRDFWECRGKSFPVFLSLVNRTFGDLNNALATWRQGAATWPYAFMGGGFGFSGAVKGMAVAYGLNELVRASNNAKEQALAGQLISQWQQASPKLRALEQSVGGIEQLFANSG